MVYTYTDTQIEMDQPLERFIDKKNNRWDPEGSVDKWRWPLNNSIQRALIHKISTVSKNKQHSIQPLYVLAR